MAEFACPCCGAPMTERPAPVELLNLRLGGKERELLELLVARYPNEVRKEAIVSNLWGMDPNGGPEDAGNVVSVHAHFLSKRLAAAGWHVGSHGTHGVVSLRRVNQPKEPRYDH